MSECPDCGMRDDDWFLCRRENCGIKASEAAAIYVKSLERQIAELRAENDRLKRGLMGAAMFARPAALSGSGAGGWRTMDSAPKDGTVIEAVYSSDFSAEPDRVFWQSEGRCCVLGSRAGAYPPGWTSEIAGNLPVDEPSHWRPAAPFPKGE